MPLDPPLNVPWFKPLPDISAARNGRSHGRHLLPNSNATRELPQGNGSRGIPDEQKVGGWGGVGEPWGAVHTGLYGQLVAAGVQLADEGGVILGL